MKLIWAAILLCGACATTQSDSTPQRQPIEDAIATEVVSKDTDVRQCVMMERVRDPGFKSAHARLHVAAGGTVESVAMVNGHDELGNCILRALNSKSLDGVAPNEAAFDYDVEL
jgi:hypothetical protein